MNGWDEEHPLQFAPQLEFETTYSGSDIYLSYTFTEPGRVIFYCGEHGDNGLVFVE